MSTRPQRHRGPTTQTRLEDVGDAAMVSLDRNGLEILDRRECLALLGGRELGRVGLVAYGLPVILPVNYRVLGDDIVFATGTGSKSLSVAHEQVIAFQVDDTVVETRSGWSVLVVAKATELTERDGDWDAAQRLDLHPWVGHFADQLVRVPTERITGRRLVGPVARRPRS